LEGIIAVAAGVMAGSISLVGLGVDSFIEMTSGVALSIESVSIYDPLSNEK